MHFAHDLSASLGDVREVASPYNTALRSVEVRKKGEKRRGEKGTRAGI